MENFSSLPAHSINTSAASYEVYLNQEEKEILTVVYSLLGLIGLLGNAIVVYTVVSYGNHIDVPANIFILSQAFADLGTVAAVPIYIIHMHSWIWEVFFIYTIFVWLASLGSLFLLTFNRLVSILDALKYTRRITPCRARCLVVAIWLAALLVSQWHLYCDMASVHYFDMGRYYIVALLTFVMLSNAYLFRESRKQATRIKRQSSAVVTGLQNNLREDFKSVRTLTLVGGTFLLSCLPFTLVVFAYGDDKKSVRFQRNAAFWGPLMTINTILDPVIYYFRSSEFRAFYARCRRLRGQRRRQFDTKLKPFVIFNANKRTQVSFCG